jgi:anti-anti-sigma regulatory factor
LQTDVIEKLKEADGEVVLDFSSVPRLDTAAATAMENLADLAGPASVRIAIRSVNVDVYKVLKLLKLTQRFSFVS